MSTLVAFLGLANIIAIGVKGKRNAYILRLFSYRWNCSGITGQMPWRSNAGISRYSVSVWELVPTRGNSVVGCSIEGRGRVRSCKLEISPGESSSMDSTGEPERGCGNIWDTRWGLVLLRHGDHQDATGVDQDRVKTRNMSEVDLWVEM